MRPSSPGSGTPLRAGAGEMRAVVRGAGETIVFGASARCLWTSRSGGDRTPLASTGMADLNLSSKDARQSSAEPMRLSDDAGRPSKAVKRWSSDAFWQPGISDRSAAASKPTCGSKLASATRLIGRADPSGTRTGKMSGWIVPKTEIPEPGNPVSAGPACVPPDLRTKLKNIAGRPEGTRADPQSSQYVPTRTPTSPLAQRPTATYVPRRAGKKTLDCGINGSAQRAAIAAQCAQVSSCALAAPLQR